MGPVTKPHQTAKQGTRFTVTSRNTTMVEVTTTTIVAACLLGFLIIINIIAFLYIWRNRRMRENEIRMKENPEEYESYDTDTENRQSYDYYNSYSKLVEQQ